MSTFDLDEQFAVAERARREMLENTGGGGGVSETTRRATSDTETVGSAAEWRSALSSVLSGAAERQLRAAWIERRRQRNEFSVLAVTGDCTLSCKRNIAHFDVRVFACAPSVVFAPSRAHVVLDDSACRDVPTGGALHVCCAEFCAGYALDALAQYHWHDRTTVLRDAGFSVCAARIHGGGVYWCERHTRMHVCTATCTNTFTNSLGYTVCVLSGHTLRAPLSVSFGSGTVLLSREMQWQRDSDAAARRQTLAVQRSALSAIETVVTAGNSHVLEHSPTSAAGASGGGGAATTKKRPRIDLSRSVHATSRRNLFTDDSRDRLRRSRSPSPTDCNVDDNQPTVQGGAERHLDVYIDADAPADDLFPNELTYNTFGDGIATELARWYAQAYASTHLLLFSEQRAAIEVRNRRAVLRDARHRIDSYINGQRKARRPVILATCRQIEMRVLNSRRIYPEMLVPRNARARLTAYYALVCMEFYLQLVQSVCTLMPRFSETMRVVAERFQAVSFASVAPNILDLMHEGLRINGHVIIDAESLLSIFPESQTIDELGINQKTCTDVKKMIKKCIVAATAANEPLERLRTTRLDAIDVIFGDDSVVSLFLGRRRVRLGMMD